MRPIIINLVTFCFLLVLSSFSYAQDTLAPIVIHSRLDLDWVELDARIEPINQGTLSAQTSGRVSRITVDVNDVVPADTLLIKINNTNQSAEEERAKAALQGALARQKDADQQRQRMRTLVNQGRISQREFDAAKTEADGAKSAVNQAKAALVQAKENLGYTEIVAPYAGIVSKRYIALGESVNPGQPLLSGYDFQHMRLVVDIPSRLRAGITDKIPIRVTLPNGKELTLTEHQLFQFADPSSHSFTLRINLPEQEKPIFHNGDWAKVAIPVATRFQIHIPPKAILHQGELTAVYVKQGTKWVLRQIRVGNHQPSGIEVLSGLEDGEQIAPDAWAIARQQGG